MGQVREWLCTTRAPGVLAFSIGQAVAIGVGRCQFYFQAPVDVQRLGYT